MAHGMRQLQNKTVEEPSASPSLTSIQDIVDILKSMGFQKSSIKTLRFYQPPKKSGFIAVHFGGIYFGTELAVLQEGLVDDLSVAQQEHGGLVTSRLEAAGRKR